MFTSATTLGLGEAASVILLDKRGQLQTLGDPQHARIVAWVEAYQLVQDVT